MEFIDLKESMLNTLKVAIKRVLSRSMRCPVVCAWNPWVIIGDIKCVLDLWQEYYCWSCCLKKWDHTHHLVNCAVSHPGWGSGWLTPCAARNYSVAQKPTSSRESCLCFIRSLSEVCRARGGGGACCLIFHFPVWFEALWFSRQWNGMNGSVFVPWCHIVVRGRRCGD